MKFNVDDWCFHEGALKQVKRVDGEIAELTDWTTNISGRLWDECFPLNRWNKIASDHAQYCRERFHEEGVHGLNYPGIARKITALWVDACEHPEDAQKLKAIEDWTTAALNKIRDMKYEMVDDVRLLGRR